MAIRTIHFALAILLLPSSLSTFGQSKDASPALRDHFVRDENRHYVYLRFDHLGIGAKFSDDEPPKRLWLHFVNNCNVGIVLGTFGVPDGSLKGEVGLIHYVVRDQPVLTITGVRADGSPLDAPSADSPQEQKMPEGYDAEAHSVAHLAPGESVLFSIPVNHLGTTWHIKIPYTFEIPKGRGPRPDDVGGEPQMVLLYSRWDLPKEIEKQLFKTH
ncbi:MAG: hypothetical protein ABSE82_14015 [Nitrososphaerales archaeon]